MEAEHSEIVCQRTDKTGSAVHRRAGSGQLRSAHTAETVNDVSDLICLQEDHSGTHLSTRQIAAELDISLRYALLRFLFF